MKLFLISLGCTKNLVDSEMILGLSAKQGIKIVSSPEEADLLFVNTCGFIEAAKKEAIDTVLAMLDYQKQGKKVVVTGCLVKRYKADLEQSLHEVDRYIGLDEYDQMGQILAELTQSPVFDQVELSPHVRLRSTDKHLAYVKISEGCDNLCTYCAIPLIRGRFVSRPLLDIVKEVKAMISEGVKEIVLISQDTTRYGKDFKDGTTLVHLLAALTELEGLHKLRLLYLYPDEVSDALIDFIKHHKVVAPYFDLPIQHASDAILKKMNRRGDAKLLTTLVNKIRTEIPHATLRTTVICGFPGETQEDFDALLDFVKTARFDRLGAFAYSKEEDTKSYHFKGQISEKVKNARVSQILEAQRYISLSLNQDMIGKTVEVIVEGKNADFYIGRSDAYAPDDIDGHIEIRSHLPLKKGDIVLVEITDADFYTLGGVHRV